jgi:hypothetical protein
MSLIFQLLLPGESIDQTQNYGLFPTWFSLLAFLNRLHLKEIPSSPRFKHPKTLNLVGKVLLRLLDIGGNDDAFSLFLKIFQKK